MTTVKPETDEGRSTIRLTPNAAYHFEREATRVGRNRAPALLLEWWWHGRLSVGDLRAVIATTWSMAEFPASTLGISSWVDLFKAAGFIDGDKPDIRQPHARPTEPLTLYRGTTWGRRRGMSWTRNSDTALWFAERFRLTGSDAMVFRVEVQPEALLAVLTGETGRPTEMEAVVDPSQLPPITRALVTSL